MISVILAFNRPLPDRRDAEGNTVTPEQWLPQDYGGSWVHTAWREPEIAESPRIVFDVLLTDDALPKIESDFPDVIVIGEWDARTGAKKRAIHARAIDVMPDIIERDADGNEISRNRPTELCDHHLWVGMAARDWN